MPRLRIGIVFGGCSEEHPISVKSARQVAASIDTDAYQPTYLGITPSGTWLLCDGPDPGWEDTGQPAVLSPDRGRPGVLVLNQDRRITLDVVLPVLHGRYGEDGAIQGLLELAGIPYVGCDIQASALCMDKSLTYLVAEAAGIATPTFRVAWPLADPDPDELSYPVFVKPARSGSSYGVTRVDRPEDLAAAMAVARQYDAKVIVEQAVVGHEVGCAVLGNGDDLVTGEVDRVALSHGFFRIHQESNPEQGSENATFVVPADIPEVSYAAVKEAATAIYRALGCRGLARVDVFLTAQGEVVLNEVNTLPGLTSYSRYPRMMAAAGVSLTELVDRLVQLALTGATR